MEYSFEIRLARLGEEKALSELALRAKSYWPYDEKFIEDCREDLKLDPIHILEKRVFVCEVSGRAVGYYGFDHSEMGPEMICLFVEPQFIGRGLGYKLWIHSLEFAKKQQWSKFMIVADPYAAEHFYLKVGCRKVGEYKSPVREGRILPLLRYDLEVLAE